MSLSTSFQTPEIYVGICTLQRRRCILRLRDELRLFRSPPNKITLSEKNAKENEIAYATFGSAVLTGPFSKNGKKINSKKKRLYQTGYFGNIIT